MPIIHTMEQGTPEWLVARCGKPTSSCFDKILTPKKLQISSQADTYANHLLAEFILGYPLDMVEQTEFMERGQELEDRAVETYEEIVGVETDRIGFITTDDGRIGCSPDRLIGARKLLEIKCPSPAVHVAYMRNKAIDDRYKCQLQGCLWVAERDEVHIVSYHPDIPAVIIPVRRDEEFIAALSAAVTQFADILDCAKRDLEAKYGPFVRRPKEDPPDTQFDITGKDIDAVWDRAQAQRG